MVDYKQVLEKLPKGTRDVPPDVLAQAAAGKAAAVAPFGQVLKKQPSSPIQSCGHSWPCQWGREGHCRGAFHYEECSFMQIFTCTVIPGCGGQGRRREGSCQGAGAGRRCLHPGPLPL